LLVVVLAVGLLAICLPVVLGIGIIHVVGVHLLFTVLPLGVGLYDKIEEVRSVRKFTS
jgi:hypothetical protein